MLVLEWSVDVYVQRRAEPEAVHVQSKCADVCMGKCVDCFVHNVWSEVRLTVTEACTVRIKI